MQTFKDKQERLILHHEEHEGLPWPTSAPTRLTDKVPRSKSHGGSHSISASQHGPASPVQQRTSSRSAGGATGGQQGSYVPLLRPSASMRT